MRKAMTLVEVMVALGILAVIGTITIATLSNTLQARELLSENDAHQQSVRVALDTVTRELELAYLTFNTQVPNSYVTVFVAKDETPVDNLWFATLAHQRLYRNSRESDQSEISIWAEDDPEMEGAYVLMHREAPRIDHEPDKDGVIYPLAYGVTRFTIRFLDPTTCEWADEWDSTSTEQDGRLPRAAQIVLGVMGPDPDDADNEELVERSYATTVLLQYGKRARCDLFSGQDEEDENVGAGTGPGDLAQ
ncbi:MAG TPA: type II secretion system protein GspJ [Myxococcota bacterium]|jgi:general secretion pathway protein J|nr:type II secretion system protein GspJ [Myxococcota bacterium]